MYCVMIHWCNCRVLAPTSLLKVRSLGTMSDTDGSILELPSEDDGLTPGHLMGIEAGYLECFLTAVSSPTKPSRSFPSNPTKKRG